MGINNIHILIDEPQHPEMNPSARKVQEYVEAKRVLEHKAGRHPWGSKRRDCPLCVSGK